MTLWHPEATRVPLADAGPYTGGGHKLLWHTIEGFYNGPSLYHGTQPQFTLKVKKRDIFQHIPINRSGMALKHPPGTGETNHDNVIQVELEGFAFVSPRGEYPEYEVRNWTEGDYAFIADFARWVEENFDVPQQAGVSFSHPVRMSWTQWHAYVGHCGHVHAPYNDHTDPGTPFDIRQVLVGGGGKITHPSPARWRTVRRGATGESVHHLQVLLRGCGYRLTVDGVFGPTTDRAVRTFQQRHHLAVDGVVGAKTWKTLSTSFNARRKR